VSVLPPLRHGKPHADLALKTDSSMTVLGKFAATRRQTMEKKSIFEKNSFFLTALMILVFFSGLIICERDAVGSQKSRRCFEGGYAERTPNGTCWILNLSGSWLEMGRQYGGLTAPELQRFYSELTQDLDARGIDRNSRVISAREIRDGYSPQLRELLAGISRTSGLSMDQTLILNAGMILLTQAVLNGSPPAACSGIAAWENFSRDRTLIFGRNWDIDRQAMRHYMQYLAVVVFHPPSGHALANIHPLGNVYLETGMNSRGLFMELNNGEHSDPTECPDREDTSSVLVSVLAGSSTVRDAADMLKAVPADLSYILQIADPEGAVSLERPTFGARIRPADDEGLIIAYNSFVPPYPEDWRNRIVPPPPPDVDPRYDNMLNMARSPAYKGAFSPKKMMDYLAVPVEQGGAYHAGTVLQIVAVPIDRTVWIRGCEYSDWERVALGPYFDEHP
jgi:hypothetical protein